MAFFSRPQSASSAVKIVNPNSFKPQERPSSTSKALSPRKDSVQRQCRNILIYGSCKFQGKGCGYYHPGDETPTVTPSRSESPIALGPSMSAQAVNAPVFVPKFSSGATSPPPLMDSRRSSSGTTPSPPSPEFHPLAAYQGEVPIHEEYQDYDYHQGGEAHIENLTHQFGELDPFYDDGHYAYGHHDKIPMYSAPGPTMYLREPVQLNYHMYTSSIPSAFTPSSTDSHFIPPSSELRQQLQARSEAIREYPPTMVGALNLPDEIQGYHSFVPLEFTADDRRKLLDLNTMVYRAVNSTDGISYLLRRVENYRLMHHSAFAAVEAWNKIRHPGIVPLHEAFTTRSFDDNSLVLVYTYYPGAKTLIDAHFKPKAPTFHQRSSMLIQSQPTTIPERTMWSYIMQIASAVKKVHDAKLAIRGLDPNRILVTGKNRVRISGCGLVDVLMHDAPQDIHYLQQDDLTNFGRLIFAMCCCNSSAASPPNFQRSIEHMARNYSPEIKNAALFLISKANQHKTIGNFIENFVQKIVVEMDDAFDAADRLENELLSELENARLVRLLCKFGFINERPEFAMDPRWSETGDRYIVKLFRDYVFHQVGETGRPVTNLSHVLTCLNKLDAGADEKVMLIARDEQSCLVVTYKEIKRCINDAFEDLTGGGG